MYNPALINESRQQYILDKARDEFDLLLQVLNDFCDPVAYNNFLDQVTPSAIQAILDHFEAEIKNRK